MPSRFCPSVKTLIMLYGFSRNFEIFREILRFFTAVLLKIQFFCDVTLYRPSGQYFPMPLRHFVPKDIRLQDTGLEFLENGVVICQRIPVLVNV